MNYNVFSKNLYVFVRLYLKENVVGDIIINYILDNIFKI